MNSTQDQIADALREDIVRGIRHPGSRLPPRQELARQFSASPVTVHGAVRRLVDEGFLQVGARKLGTLVAETPPHLCRYRLVFPRGREDWRQFWYALETAARERSCAAQEFTSFYGLGGHRDISEYRELVDAVQTQRVAGLIFASDAEELRGTPLWEQPGLPRVAIAPRGMCPGVAKAMIDLDAFCEKAVDHLLQQGRRRIALLCESVDMLDQLRHAMHARGLASQPLWEQFANFTAPSSAAHVMQLLFRMAGRDRPDGLIISDDTFLTAATEGIVAAGVPGPDDLSVVAMTNFPNILPAAFPVTRLGYDVPAVLGLLVELLGQIQRGETPPDTTVVRPIFEHEYACHNAGVG